MILTNDERLTIKIASSLLRKRVERPEPTDYDRYCAEIGLKLQAVYEALAREAAKEKKPGGLKPCPFCGKPPFLADRVDPRIDQIGLWIPEVTSSWYLTCCQALASGKTRKEVIAAWNRRAGDE